MTAEEYAKETAAHFKGHFTFGIENIPLSRSAFEDLIALAFRAGQAQTAKNILDPDKARGEA